ncbi:alanine transaminase, partial [Nitrospinae bacterium AH_259_B05_G02_I21]|nr:alanine transaminase [Nitrospinae bacterium AH_259_B05_G02_I21]
AQALLGADGDDRFRLVVEKAKVAVSPGVGFGPFGDEHVRFAMVENIHRTRQAIKGIKAAL